MNVVTLGGQVLGWGLLVRQGIVWWPGVSTFRKDWKRQVSAIGPFIFAWCYGALLIMCAGGLLGGIADFALWGGSWIGDGALVWGVGGQAQDNVTRGTAQVLTNGGHAIVLLCVFVFFALLRRGKVDSGAMWAGAVSGILMGLSAGVAGLAVTPLANVANLAGALFSREVLT